MNANDYGRVSGTDEMAHLTRFPAPRRRYAGMTPADGW
jgi:hypothetical protein